MQVVCELAQDGTVSVCWRLHRPQIRKEKERETTRVVTKWVDFGEKK